MHRAAGHRFRQGTGPAEACGLPGHVVRPAVPSLQRDAVHRGCGPAAGWRLAVPTPPRPRLRRGRLNTPASSATRAAPRASLPNGQAQTRSPGAPPAPLGELPPPQPQQPYPPRPKLRRKRRVWGALASFIYTPRGGNEAGPAPLPASRGAGTPRTLSGVVLFHPARARVSAWRGCWPLAVGPASCPPSVAVGGSADVFPADPGGGPRRARNGARGGPGRRVLLPGIQRARPGAAPTVRRWLKAARGGRRQGAACLSRSPHPGARAAGLPQAKGAEREAAAALAARPPALRAGRNTRAEGKKREGAALPQWGWCALRGRKECALQSGFWSRCCSCVLRYRGFA